MEFYSGSSKFFKKGKATILAACAHDIEHRSTNGCSPSTLTVYQFTLTTFYGVDYPCN